MLTKESNCKSPNAYLVMEILAGSSKWYVMPSTGDAYI